MFIETFWWPVFCWKRCQVYRDLLRLLRFWRNFCEHLTMIWIVDLLEWTFCFVCLWVPWRCWCIFLGFIIPSTTLWCIFRLLWSEVSLLSIYFLCFYARGLFRVFTFCVFRVFTFWFVLLLNLMRSWLLQWFCFCWGIVVWIVRWVFR
jgi:hypothetical protein